MSEQKSDEAGCWLLFLMFLILMSSCGRCVVGIESKLGQIRDELRAQREATTKK